MKRTVILIFGAAISILALSCSSETLEPEADYDFPFTIETRGDSSSAVEIYQLYLITDTEEDQYADMDFLSCRASLVPGHSISNSAPVHQCTVSIFVFHAQDSLFFIYIYTYYIIYIIIYII